MPKHGNIPPKADHLTFPEWDGEEWLFPSADAIHDAIIAYGGKIDPYEQLRFVDHNNTESGRDGSLSNPYQSITEAETDITDATNSKKYQLLVFPGVYAESLALKPYISIRGVSKENVQLQGAYTLASAGRVLLQDLTINGSLTINSSGFPSATAFDLHTVDILGAVTINARGAGSDGFVWNYVRAFSNVAITGASLTVSNSYFYGSLSLTTGGSVASAGNLLSASIKSSYMGGTLSATAAATHSGIVRFWQSTVAGITVLTNNGVTLTAEFDIPSWPQSTFTVGGTGTIPVVNRLNLATNQITIAGAGGIGTIFSAHINLVRAVHLIIAVEHPSANEYSSILVHAVHNGVTASASASEVGDKQIQAIVSVGIAGSFFQVYLTNNEAAAITAEARFFDV